MVHWSSGGDHRHRPPGQCIRFRARMQIPEAGSAPSMEANAREFDRGYVFVVRCVDSWCAWFAIAGRSGPERRIAGKSCTLPTEQSACLDGFGTGTRDVRGNVAAKYAIAGKRHWKGKVAGNDPGCQRGHPAIDRQAASRPWPVVHCLRQPVELGGTKNRRETKHVASGVISIPGWFPDGDIRRSRGCREEICDSGWMLTEREVSGNERGCQRGHPIIDRQVGSRPWSAVSSPMNDRVQAADE